ncbi:PTS ascorbate transporter subunit IIB [Treponema phagedenis]|uniref:PTS sugar transporter subunit IIB n=1 Tax=Treponema phagedenis TaxID=162 RepID=A0A0B7GV45_TREPH|nr:PTS sugar transporter subunit IIB [Treponema phagedenis]NVP24382.1 PTS sugar transporter subunit IIB [Treponema phagedenis]NVP25616.1 PTS sugar transporter subunit IIB [Treponema phagedenis]QEJ96080.1 PTS sugar transporter subunit IIB [Treponema phagedenis]QEJ99021.1 PTS sugar transporter subunit IIB [Treponema phagedenis]QEK01843.1 PTS sugar transporter subunit IIB [Treponema phagedenis]
MKILIVCGSGLGSSFMMEMNVKNILEAEGISGIEVDHTDLSSAKGMQADLYIGTRDITNQFTDFPGEILSLSNMIDKDYIKTELLKKLKEMNVI